VDEAHFGDIRLKKVGLVGDPSNSPLTTEKMPAFLLSANKSGTAILSPLSLERGVFLCSKIGGNQNEISKKVC
jgi:hypothetical protein